MKEFMLIFRDKTNCAPLPPDEMVAKMKLWRAWIAGLAAQGNYSSTNRLIPDQGVTINAGNTVTDGPYAESKELLGGYLIIKANTLNEAVEIAKGCPGLQAVTSVEVREVMSIEYDTTSDDFLMPKN